MALATFETASLAILSTGVQECDGLWMSNGPRCTVYAAMRPTILTLTLAMLLLALARPAAAIPAPADPELAQWREACAAGGHLRVVTRTAIFTATHAELDSLGVRLSADASHAAFGAFEYPSGNRDPIAWRDIRAIERAHGSGLIRGMTVGIFTGGALGLLLGLALEGAVQNTGLVIGQHSDDFLGGLVIRSAAIGGGIGALIGSASTSWVPIAP